MTEEAIPSGAQVVRHARTQLTGTKVLLQTQFFPFSETLRVGKHYLKRSEVIALHNYLAHWLDTGLLFSKEKAS